jgi:hypothetical protein
MRKEREIKLFVKEKQASELKWLVRRLEKF